MYSKGYTGLDFFHRLTEYEKVEPVFYYNIAQQQTTTEANMQEKTTGKWTSIL